MHQAKKLFIPTGFEISVYFIISLIILSVSNIEGFVSFLTKPSGVPETSSEILKTYSQDILDYISSYESIGIMVNVLFWASVGAIIYLILLVAINILIATRNEVEIVTHFTGAVATSFNRRQYLIYTVSRGILRAAFLQFILFLTAISALFWYPVFVSFFGLPLIDKTNANYWVMAFLSVMGLMAIFYLYTILLRLLFLRTRVFS